MRSRRRWRRPLLAVLVLGLAAWFAPHIVLHTRLRGELIRRVAPELADRLEVDRVSAAWTRPIELSGVRYRHGSCEFTAARIDCDRTLIELLLEPDTLVTVRVSVPRLTLCAGGVADRTEGGAERGAEFGPRSAAVEPVPRARDLDRPPARVGRGQAAAGGHARSVRLIGTGGEVWIDGGPAGPACVARAVEFLLELPAGSREAAFRLQARTGDPQATAHVTAQGKTAWPIQSLVSDLERAHVELVGVDFELVRSLAGALAHRPDADRVAAPAWCGVDGRLSGTIEFHAAPDGSGLGARANGELQRLEWPGLPPRGRGERPAIACSAVARVLPDRIEIDSARLCTTGIILDARGAIWDWPGRSEVDLAGSADLDWVALHEHWRGIVPKGLQLTGRARRPWSLRTGSSAEPASPTLALRVASWIESLVIAGFEFGPLELVAHWADDAVRLEPIECTFQNGTVRIDPAVRFDDEIPVLAVAPGRVIDRVAIDHELSHAMLRYVDPLGTIARDLDGHLSVDIHEMSVPLDAAAARFSAVSGRVLLDDVQIAPEASLREILAIAGIDPPERIRTSQSVELALRDGRVHHTGLALPIADESVTLDGWVDLEQNIHIIVSLPVTERMLGKDKRLYRMLRGQRIELPVTGTLERPRVSSEAMAQSIHRLVQTALRDTFGRDDILRGLFKRSGK